jgi:hypothetical protein
VTIISEDRFSDSPYVDLVSRGWTVSDGSAIRPAECNWHMVFVKHPGGAIPYVVGPLKTSGVATWGAGAEILWIRFRLGTFMPHMRVKHYLDVETALPGAASRKFWLKGSSWQFPDYENVETFVNKLMRDEILVRDPVVHAVLQGHPQDMASRTVRDRFLRTTGLTQTHIYQVERAKRAAALLRQGFSILDTVDEAGYFDQPHLTRALKHWIGYTPAQIASTSIATSQVS